MMFASISNGHRAIIAAILVAAVMISATVFWANSRYDGHDRPEWCQIFDI